MAGASTMTPGETFPAHSVLMTSHRQSLKTQCLKSLLYILTIAIEMHSLLTCSWISWFISIYLPTVWLQSQKTSFRQTKPMCCSTSAATATPPRPMSGNRPESGWAGQPIRATLPPVSIETNKTSSVVTLASMNFSFFSDFSVEKLFSLWEGLQRWSPL